MTLRHRAGWLLLLLLVAVAARAGRPAVTADYTMSHLGQVVSDCHAEDCPRLRASFPVFAADATLSAWVDSGLAAFATGADAICGQPATSVQALADRYLNDGGDIHASCSLSARVVWESARLVVVRFDVGADRHWANRTVVYNRMVGKGLTLDDMLLPGAHERFDALFHDAEAGAFEDGSTACPWPRSPGNTSRCEFPASTEFAPAAEGIYVIYQIPPVDSAGQGTTLQFLATYAQLQGILRLEWLPGTAPAAGSGPRP